MSAHLTYFEILGLDEPPIDRKAVKRAYSKKLKVTRPEDDPEGFMRLRDAHDLALIIVARNAHNTASDSEIISVEACKAKNIETYSAPVIKQSLSYTDMLPRQEPEPDTGYAIGATPNLEAPLISHTPPISQIPKLIERLDLMLTEPEKYNDRAEWNALFRKARQLDIDDYVDFENLLLERILSFHDYSYDHPLFEKPEEMPRKLSPSIAASLFKTMSWDQVNRRGQYRGNQIEWLERRISVRKRTADPVPIPETDSDKNWKIWAILLGAFILVKVIQALVAL